METAERDFFEAAGGPLRTKPGELVGWPRVRAECKFSAPLRFGDTIDIHMRSKRSKTDQSIINFVFSDAKVAAALRLRKVT